MAESLIAEHAQLRKATLKYPDGPESFQREMESRQRNTPQTGTEGSFIFVGAPDDFSYGKTLRRASQSGDFSEAIESALEKYKKDNDPRNPNLAPREFWPSTCRFRGILYRAGLKLKENARQYIDRIPDPDLQLFAKIELAAALAGLPELRGTQREFRPTRRVRRH